MGIDGGDRTGHCANEPFRTIATMSPLPIAVVRVADDELLWVNDAFCAAVGADRVDVVGARAATFTADHVPLRDRVEGDSATGIGVDGRRADGSAIRILLSANVIDYRGEPAIVASTADITSHEATIAALRHSEERLRGIAELAPFPVGVTRLADAALVYVNRAFAEFMQTTPEQLLGRPAPEFYSNPLDRDAMLAQLRERGSLVDHQILARRPDGVERLVLVNMRILTFDGEPSIMAAVADITDWQAAESALREERMRLARVLEIAGDAILSVDASMSVVLFNRGAEEVFGYTEDEALGQPLEIFIPEGSRALHSDHVASFAAGDETARRMGLRSTVQGRRKSGELFPAAVSISRLALRGEEIFTAIVRDVTAAQAAEQALEVSRTQLLQSQKMEAVGRLAGGVAHDFNNLLTAIYGGCAMLTRKLPPDSPSLAEVDDIQSAATRAAQLTRQLLAISRKQATLPAVVDVNAVVEPMRAMLHRVIGENIALETRLQTDSLPIEIDPSQLEQVILNLVINASDAIAGQGTITVETAVRGLDETMDTATGRIGPGSWATLAVRDTGHGVDDVTLAHMFEPFYTTKRAGTGLGLSTVAGIVAQSRGAIEVAGALGEGTTFRVWLPVYHGDVVPMTTERMHAATVGGSECILVAEDDPRVRRLATRELEDLGYDVHVAANATDALALAVTVRTPIDLVLTDVVMPGTSGRELAAAVAASLPSAKILYMSGYSDDALADKGFERGDVHLLRKPFSPDELAAKVRSVLDH